MNATNNCSHCPSRDVAPEKPKASTGTRADAAYTIVSVDTTAIATGADASAAVVMISDEAEVPSSSNKANHGDESEIPTAANTMCCDCDYGAGHNDAECDALVQEVSQPAAVCVAGTTTSGIIATLVTGAALPLQRIFNAAGTIRGVAATGLILSAGVYCALVLFQVARETGATGMVDACRRIVGAACGSVVAAALALGALGTSACMAGLLEINARAAFEQYDPAVLAGVAAALCGLAIASLTAANVSTALLRVDLGASRVRRIAVATACAIAATALNAVFSAGVRGHVLAATSVVSVAALTGVPALLELHLASGDASATTKVVPIAMLGVAVVSAFAFAACPCLPLHGCHVAAGFATASGLGFACAVGLVAHAAVRLLSCVL